MMEVTKSNYPQSFYNTSPNEILKVENNFNYSVASLGDIYSPYLNKKKEIELNTVLFDEEEKSNFQRPKSSLTTRTKYPNNLKSSKKQLKINEVTLDFNPDKKTDKDKKISKASDVFKRKEYDVNKDPAQKNRNVKINYLKNTELPESKVFSHVVQGLINPVKSSFSLKKITETHIKNHEKEMKPIVLYPDKVNINRIELDPVIPGQLKKQNRNDYNQSQNEFVIGEANNTQIKEKKKEIKDNHVSFEKPKFSNFKRNEVSSASARKTLNTSEKFFSSIDDYFISNSMKIPSRKKIDEIAKEASQLEKALLKFEDELTGRKKKKIKKFEVQYERKLRQSGKKIDKKKEFPKVYPDIDGNYQKNIQEKLSSLQIELRQLFDQIIQEKGKGGDVKKLMDNIKRAKEITKLIKHLSEDVKRGEKELKESMKIKKKSKSPTMRKNNETNFNKSYRDNNLNRSFNPSQSIDMGNMGNINNSNVQSGKQIVNKPFNNTTNSFNPIVEDIGRESNSNFQSQNQPNVILSQTQVSNSQIGNNQNFNPNSTQSLYNSQNNFPIQYNNNVPNNLMTTQSTVSQPNINTNESQMSQSLYTSQNNKLNPNYNQSSITQNQLPQYTNTINTNNNITVPQYTITQNLYKTQYVNQPPQTTNINNTFNPQMTNTNNSFNPQMTNTNNSFNPQITNQPLLKSQNITMTQNITKPNLPINNTMKSSIPTNSFQHYQSQSENINNNPLLYQSGVINDPTMTINHFPVKTNQLKVETQNYIEDDRFSSFKVQFPVKYYYQLTKENEPPDNKDWYIRPHHTETFSKSENAIADDILNTKYISYYSPNDVKESGINKSRQEILEELISETHNHIKELQNQMKNKATNTKRGKNLIQKLENLKEEVKQNYVPGKFLEDRERKKGIVNILKDPNDKTSFSQMFDSNENVHQTNITIDAYSKMLEELRNKERELLIIKRKEEYERIRPPKKNWYELKGEDFISEMMRNKMVLNAGPEYFEKINALTSEDLF